MRVYLLVGIFMVSAACGLDPKESIPVVRLTEVAIRNDAGNGRNDDEKEPLVRFFVGSDQDDPEVLNISIMPTRAAIRSASFSFWKKGKKVSKVFEVTCVLTVGELGCFVIEKPKDFEIGFFPEDRISVGLSVATK